MSHGSEPARTGTITLHYGHNEGAILQARALSMLLASEQQGNAEVLDRRYPGKRASYGPANDARKRALQRAIDTWLPLSPAFHEDSDLPARDYANAHYKHLVVGSDVVWALRYAGRLRRLFPGGIFPVQRDPFFPPFPNVYWPDHQWHATKVSYAACTGNLDMGEVPRSHRNRMAETLDGFSHISVRDTRSLQQVARLSRDLARRCRIVCDPTLAWDLHAGIDSTALDLRMQQLLDADKPRLLLIMKHTPLSHAICNHFLARGYQVLASGAYGRLPVHDLSRLGFSPLEWSLLPRYFDLCVTERMHMSIFCLRNNARFVALDMNPRIPGTMTKLEELLETFDMQQCYRHQDGLDEASVLALLEQALGGEPDWSRVNGRIRQSADDAASFLFESGLSSGKN